MYERLRPVQGLAIPIYFGEARCDDVPAILLSDIGGFPLCDPKVALTNEGDVVRMLYDAFGALAGLGIVHDDVKLDNYHLVGNKIMIVDLERAEVVDKKVDFFVDSNIDHLMGSYRSHQKCLEEDGLI